MALPELDEPLGAAEYVVHLPLPDALKADRDARVALLEGVEHLLLVGSPTRARKVAERAAKTRGATIGCYCDLTQPGRDETGREFAVWIVRMAEGPVVAVASHGVGLSGVEIILSELPALVSLTSGGRFGAMKTVLRSGTRGTVAAQVPLGCVALSTACYHDTTEGGPILPDAGLTDLVRSAARHRGMEIVPDEAIEGRAAAGWGDPARLLIEGPGMATTFFWEGQGRPMFVPGEGPTRRPSRPAETAARAAMLKGWCDQGIRWLEMEDYTVHRLARACGYPSASVGAVIASRRRADGRFQVDYDHEAHQRAELIPTELALDTILLAGRG